MNRETLKEYAKLRKLPKFIKLGDISKKARKKFTDIAEPLSITNDKNIKMRKEFGLVYEDSKSPLGKVYDSRHIDDLDVSSIECINKFTEKFNWRFGKLKPCSEIPEHLDPASSYRFLIILSGYCHFISEDDSIKLISGDVYYVNSAYKHKVINGEYERLALLGEMKINDNNTKLLRTKS